MTEDDQGLQERHCHSVGRALARRVDAGDDDVQQGGAHPLQLLHQTLIVTVQLVIAGLSLAERIYRRSLSVGVT